jgi:hypothetical protein
VFQTRFSLLQAQFRSFQTGSGPVQLVSGRFSLLLLDPGLIVLFFVHFTHFIGCVVVSLGLVGIIDPLCSRFDTI